MMRCAILIPSILLITCANAWGAEVAWRGTLSVDFVSLSPIHITGEGVATVDGPGFGIDSLRFDGGITGASTTSIWSAPNPSYSISVGASVELGSGTLGPFGLQQPLISNTLPVGGVAKFCVIFPDCGSFLGLPLTLASGQAGVGVGGLVTVGSAGPIRISLDAAPWTVGTVSVSVPTPSGSVVDFTTRGWAHGPASFAGSTALTGGELSIVTPMQVTSGSVGNLTSFARLQVRFVPEPVLGVLLLSGVVGLGLMGRSRRAESHQPRSRQDSEPK